MRTLVLQVTFSEYSASTDGKKSCIILSNSDRQRDKGEGEHQRIYICISVYSLPYNRALWKATNCIKFTQAI